MEHQAPAGRHGVDPRLYHAYQDVAMDLVEGHR
jgi:hypothetical protein